MRGVGVIEFGGPEALQLVDLAEEHAGAGEVRVRIYAAAVNPTDTMLRGGARAEALRAAGPPPYIPGMDAAGVIDEIGSGTNTDLQVGDRVMAMVVPRGQHGAYRESLVLPADAVARAPAGRSHAEAAALPMNALTARLSLDQMNLQPGQTLAVTGAAGCYGGYMVELGKADGLTIIADAAPKDEALVKELGADIIVPRGDDIAEHIRKVMPEGVDGLADGSVQNEQTVAAVKDGGHYASVRGWPGTGERSINFHITYVVSYNHRADLLETLRQQVEAGKVTLRVNSTYPAEQAAETHRLFKQGGHRGRFIITFD